MDLSPFLLGAERERILEMMREEAKKRRMSLAELDALLRKMRDMGLLSGDHGPGIEINLSNRPGTPPEGFDPSTGLPSPWRVEDLPGIGNIPGLIDQIRMHEARARRYGGLMPQVYPPPDETDLQRAVRRAGMGGMGGFISGSGDFGAPTLSIGGRLGRDPTLTPLSPDEPGWGDKEPVVQPHLAPKPGDRPLGGEP